MYSTFARIARARGAAGPPWGGGGQQGGRRPADPPPAGDVRGWFAGRLPEEWFVTAPEVTVDREEIVVIGTLPPPEGEFGDDAARAAAESGRLSRFREETREERIEIARQAEHRYGRKVAWGARAGDSEELFTTLSVPVMTRLRQPERIVLDTLVEAGVARSRSEALAWTVRLVGEHTEDWLAELRAALTRIDDLRSAGPNP